MSHCVEEQKEVGFELDVEEKGKVESCVDDLFSKLTAQFNDSQSILKTLANNLKILHKEVLKENGMFTESSEKSNDSFKFQVGKHIFEGKLTRVKKMS